MFSLVFNGNMSGNFVQNQDTLAITTARQF